MGPQGRAHLAPAAPWPPPVHAPCTPLPGFHSLLRMLAMMCVQGGDDSDEGPTDHELAARFANLDLGCGFF